MKYDILELKLNPQNSIGDREMRIETLIGCKASKLTWKLTYNHTAKKHISLIIWACLLAHHAVEVNMVSLKELPEHSKPEYEQCWKFHLIGRKFFKADMYMYHPSKMSDKMDQNG